MTEHRNRRTILLIALSFMLCFLLAGLFGGNSALAKTGKKSYTIKDFVGRWYMTTDTCYKLKIYSDGSFESLDIGAGNPGIMGTMKIVSAKKIQLNRRGDIELSGDEDKKTLKPKLKYTFKSKNEFTVRYIGRKNSKMTFKRESKKPGKNLYKANVKKPVIKSANVVATASAATPDAIVIKTTEKDDGYAFGDGYEIAYRITDESHPQSGSWIKCSLTYDEMTVKRNEEKEKNTVTVELKDIIPASSYEVKLRGYHYIGDNKYITKWSKSILF